MTTVSAETIGNNIDLLTQILVRLPAKPLIKFKCVSKQWLSLISNPQFCVSHTRHHHSPYPTPSGLFLKYYTYDHTPEFEIFPLKQDGTIRKFPSFDYLNTPGFRILQSCNGLLLCSSHITPIGKLYYICNPTTKQFKILSPPACEFQVPSTICMAFDPLKSNLYKLITVTKTDNYHIEMYSSETDSWRPLEITVTLPKRLDFADPVFCNGAVHWYSKEETSIYFNVDTECFNTMPMPNLARPGYYRMVHYFGESQGHLHLIVTGFPLPLQFDVLEMAADCSGWFLRYHVNLNDVRIRFPLKKNTLFSVLNVVRAQKEEESVVVVFVDDKIISINVHYGILKKLYGLEHSGKEDYAWSDSFEYFEILTSV